MGTRRTFLKEMTALAAISVPGIVAGKESKSGYDPRAKFELKVSEVPFRKNEKGRQLLARIYQPQGTGPFPVVLDLHGGAWQRKDRKKAASKKRPEPARERSDDSDDIERAVYDGMQDLRTTKRK